MSKETESCESCDETSTLDDAGMNARMNDADANDSELNDRTNDAYANDAAINARTNEADVNNAATNARTNEADANNAEMNARMNDAEFADDFTEDGDRGYFSETGLNAFSGDTETQADIPHNEVDSGSEFAEETAQADLPDKRYHDTLKSESDAYEEYAAEVAPYGVNAPARPVGDDTDRAQVHKTGREEEKGGKVVGWAALVLAVAALFVWPAVLGPVAAAAGIVAYLRGSKALGVWSVVIGLVALIAYMAILPLYR